MPAIITDTSPLQYLYQADALRLLPELFGEVCAPYAVAAELDAGRQQGIPLPDLSTLPWVTIRPVQQRALLPLVTNLGEGEKEVLALGLEMPGSLLLLDDRMARRHAESLSLKITGTLGVLLLAKEQGRLDAVRPLLERLNTLRFRMDPVTHHNVLRLAEELD